MNIGRACGIFMNIDSENFTEDEKLVAIRDVLKEMVTYNGITKDNILKAFRWFFDWAVEEASADSREWIPCSERLPEAEGEYLCSLYYAIPPYNLFHPENDIYIHTISIQKFDGTSFKSSVIAWMPLPEPYKVGDQE